MSAKKWASNSHDVEHDVAAHAENVMTELNAAVKATEACLEEYVEACRRAEAVLADASASEDELEDARHALEGARNRYADMAETWDEFPLGKMFRKRMDHNMAAAEASEEAIGKRLNAIWEAEDSASRP